MLNAGVNFVLALFLTNYLTKGDFGSYSIYRATIFTLWPFIGLSTHFFLQKQYFLQKKNYFSVLVFSSVLVNFTLFILVELLALFFLQEISLYLKIPKYWILTIPLVAFLLSFFKVSLVLMQVEKNLSKFLLLAFFQSFFNLFLTIYLIVFLEFNWEGRAYGLVASNTIIACVAMYFLKCHKLFNIVFDREALKIIILFGLGAIMLDICIVSIAFTDKLYINNFIGSETLGVYAVALQLAAVVSVLDTAFMDYLNPKIYKWLAENKLNEVRGLTLRYLISLASFCVLYSFLAPYIYAVFISSEFTESFEVLKWIVLSLWCLSVYKIHITRIYFYDIAKKLFVPSLAIILVNVVSHNILIPKLGYLGAIYTNVISYAFLFISVLCLLWISNRKYASK